MKRRFWAHNTPHEGASGSNGDASTPKIGDYVRLDNDFERRLRHVAQPDANAATERCVSADLLMEMAERNGLAALPDGQENLHGTPLQHVAICPFCLPRYIQMRAALVQTQSLQNIQRPSPWRSPRAPIADAFTRSGSTNIAYWSPPRVALAGLGAAMAACLITVAVLLPRLLTASTNLQAARAATQLQTIAEQEEAAAAQAQVAAAQIQMTTLQMQIARAKVEVRAARQKADRLSNKIVTPKIVPVPRPVPLESNARLRDAETKARLLARRLEQVEAERDRLRRPSPVPVTAAPQALLIALTTAQQRLLAMGVIPVRSNGKTNITPIVLVRPVATKILEPHPRLVWRPVAGVVRYKISVARLDAQGEAVAVHESKEILSTETTVEPDGTLSYALRTPLLPNAAYRWGVSAFDVPTPDAPASPDALPQARGTGLFFTPSDAEVSRLIRQYEAGGAREAAAQLRVWTEKTSRPPDTKESR